MFQEGQRLGEFEILGRLGQGGMGAVYKARQVSLNRFVALKTLQGAIASDPEYIARFRREAMAAAALNHPNLVQVHSAGESDGLHWFAMEYVEGESAQARLKRKERLDPAEAIAIAIHVATALEYGWRKAQLIHRDIKPDNIFLSSDGEVKLGDLGLAKSAGEVQSLTMTGAAMGTPHYVSPEQGEGKKDVDLRADIYSLGCTIFHLVAGKPPYGGDTAMAVMLKHVTAPIPNPQAVWPGFPGELARVVVKMMAKSPADRQQTYAEVITDLRRAYDALTSETVPVKVAVTMQPQAAQPPQPASAVDPSAPTMIVPAPDAQPPPQPAAPKSKFKPALIAAVVVVLGIVAWFAFGKKEPQLSEAERADKARAGGARSPGALLPDDDKGNAPGGRVPPLPPFPTAATKDAPFVNSLGMQFVPVPIGGGPTKGQHVLFGVWDVRVQDYAVYAAANPQTDGSWKTQHRDGVPAGREPDHPVVGVSWEDAQAFCQWLTAKETAEGKLPQDVKYRLPSDEEWSWAVGLPPESGATPEEKRQKNSVDYPWGKDWPPAKKVGNYADETFHGKFPFKEDAKYDWNKNRWIEGYTDGYATTSPVGSFPANEHGLYDMGGNVWQWCEDWYDASQEARVLRGASWNGFARGFLVSSDRGRHTPGDRDNYFGFRCVLAASPPASSGVSPTPAPQVAAPSAPQAKQTLDLIALADPLKDRLSAEGLAGANDWSRSDGRLVFKGADNKSGKICAPVALNGLRDYEIEAQTPSSVLGFLTLDFPTSPTSQLTLDFDIGKGITIASDENRQRRSLSAWPKDTKPDSKFAGRIRFDADGVNGTLTALVDGKEAGTWRGPLTKLGKPAEAHREFPGQLLPALFVFKGDREYASWTLRVFEGEAKVLRGTVSSGTMEQWARMLERPEDHANAAGGTELRDGWVVRRKNAQASVRFLGPAPLRDGAVRAEIRGTASPDAFPLLILRGNGEHWMPGYKSYKLRRTLSTVVLKYEDWGTKESVVLKEVPVPPLAENESCTLELRAVGRTLTAKLNGKELFSVEDSRRSNGLAGVFVPEAGAARNVELLNLEGTPAPAAATKDVPFVNSLGMKFVPVPITGGPTRGQRVLFSVWETRVQDYRAFIEETERRWPKAPFDQTVEHPATMLSWEDATAFCVWLTGRERKAGRLGPSDAYRLPSDHEWSCASGLGASEDPTESPAQKNGNAATIYPWGSSWPPPVGAGNYAGEELKPLLAAGKHPHIKGTITGFSDGYQGTAPVGSFAANSLGLHELSGNVWEFCADELSATNRERVLRGGAWDNWDEKYLRSGSRTSYTADKRDRSSTGFRCVLAPVAPVAPAATATAAAAPAPAQAKQTLDLIALIDPARDAFKDPKDARKAVARREGAKLVIESDGPPLKLKVPVAILGDEYELELRIGKHSGGYLHMDFPLDGAIGIVEFRDTVGASLLVSEKEAYARHASDATWPRGEPRIFKVRVKRGKSGAADMVTSSENSAAGQTWIGKLTGLPDVLVQPTAWPFKAEPCTAIYVSSTIKEIESFTLRMFSGEAKVLRP